MCRCRSLKSGAHRSLKEPTHTSHDWDEGTQLPASHGVLKFDMSGDDSSPRGARKLHGRLVANHRASSKSNLPKSLGFYTGFAAITSNPGSSDRFAHRRQLNCRLVLGLTHRFSTTGPSIIPTTPGSRTLLGGGAGSLS